MNILHVGKYFWPFRGGLENYMRDLLVALAGHGISNTALVHRHQWSFNSLTGSITLDGLDLPVVRTGTWLKVLFTPISPAFPWHFRKLLATIRPDFLHLHLPNPSAFWALALPSARRLPWVVHWHSDVATESQGWLMKLAYIVYRPFEQAVLRRAGAIVVTSPPYRDSSEALQPWLEKCRVIPLGMNAKRLTWQSPPEDIAAVSRTGRSDGSEKNLQVLAVGRFTYYKGLRYLIEAISKVDSLRLDLVGQGDQARELKQLVAKLDLQDRVTFHGPVDDQELSRLFARCDCLCLPSIERTEAFGMVLLEAMQFGKATVVSDVEGSGMGWIVEDGETGLKVKPADSNALATAFRQLASDPHALAEMGKRGRQKFDHMFDINRTVRKIIETYNDVRHSDAEVERPGAPHQ